MRSFRTSPSSILALLLVDRVPCGCEEESCPEQGTRLVEWRRRFGARARFARDSEAENGSHFRQVHGLMRWQQNVALAIAGVSLGRVKSRSWVHGRGGIACGQVTRRECVVIDGVVPHSGLVLPNTVVVSWE